MPMKLLYGLVALLALASGVATRHWLAAGPATPTAEQQAPAPAVAEPLLRDLDGRARTLAEWRGKVIVLNFWATWCGPCREEMPEFVRLQNELGGQGLQFVGVAIDEVDAVRDYLKETPVNYPVLMGDEHAPGWADQLGNALSGL
ncbi:redoxin domain-containing protein, partial [Methylomagnum sp.]